MEDIHSILANHHPKKQEDIEKHHEKSDRNEASFSSIPDVFFDVVIGKYRMSRSEISILMYLYRLVWCKPNLYREYGISPLLAYSDISQSLDLTSNEFFQSLKRLEDCRFIEKIRAGQYFVRRYFTIELDDKYGQVYNS